MDYTLLVIPEPAVPQLPTCRLVGMQLGHHVSAAPGSPSIRFAGRTIPVCNQTLDIRWPFWDNYVKSAAKTELNGLKNRCGYRDSRASASADANVLSTERVAERRL